MTERVGVGDAAIDSLESERASAFRRLADARLDDSYRLANAILADPVGAEDAVHDAFITAWRKWPSLRDRDRFEAWFRRIVVNTCHDRLRRNARRETTGIDGATTLRQPDVAGRIHERDRLERALLELKPNDRVVLALRYYQDLRIDDIATALGIPFGTATSRLRAAHGRLRDVLERSDGEGRPR